VAPDNGLQNKYKNIKAFIETSCQTGRGVNELKEIIAEEIGTLDHINNQFLNTWFNVKEQLEKMRRDYIVYPEYVQLCHNEKVVDEMSQRTLIGFLHDLGIVLNFRDDPRLEDTNILNPKWVTNGVYKQGLWIYFGVLVAIWIVVGILTLQLGWNIMEPWTYFLGGALIGSYAYFAITQKEFSPTAIYEQIIEAKRQKYYREFGFGN